MFHFQEEMLRFLISTEKLSWNLTPKWESRNLFNVKFAVKLSILFDSK